jgi:hypothetical protein
VTPQLGPAAFYTEPMPAKPRSAEYFDGWYADRLAAPAVDEIMNRHMGFPPDMRAGVVPAEAIRELAARVSGAPGGTAARGVAGVGAGKPSHHPDTPEHIWR